MVMNMVKVMVVQTVFSIVCYSHFSKCIRLSLTDFNKNMVFCRKCMWLQLRQILKEFTEGNARKCTVTFAFCAHVDIIKSKNTDVFL